ncbi:MAG TPA: type II toxin-antitoxin system antitoxin SocA domain-containing protein [Longimicrobium sp.]|nr:type II toxin-antitoxin system antitoxin SocA domain-containing protein [Longimicrobium sp.]
MASKTYTPLQIANWFLANIGREAGDLITHLKLQKLVYYAQAWSLVGRGQPLFEEDFQAWAHGPVAPSLFRAFRDYGMAPIPAPASVPRLDEETVELLTEVLDVYGEHSAKKLEQLTHRELPWREARGDLPDEARSDSVITKAAMQRYYTDLSRKLNAN